MTLEYCQNMNNCFGNLVTKQFNRGKKLNQTSRTFGVLRDWEINVASNKSVSTYAIVTVFKPCQQKEMIKSCHQHPSSSSQTDSLRYVPLYSLEEIF